MRSPSTSLKQVYHTDDFCSLSLTNTYVKIPLQYVGQNLLGLCQVRIAGRVDLEKHIVGQVTKGVHIIYGVRYLHLCPENNVA